jgi:membrane associated rhomboid family serine protease
METLELLQSLGLTLPSPAYIVGAVLFGIIGMAAFFYGRKKAQARIKWLGVALMFYPYVVWETWMLYAVGTALCAAIYFYRR